MTSRREFFVLAGAAVVAAPLGRNAGAQSVRGAANVPMDEQRYRPVSLPRKQKPGAGMSSGELDAVERQLHCQCGCTLDVFTCRTTDFSCPVSPPMHRDVMRLAEGGYSAREILDSFQAVYGERVLMAPRKSGFNWAGYLVPFVAFGGGLALVIGFLGRLRRPIEQRLADQRSDVTATPEEMARLEAALKNESA